MLTVQNQIERIKEKARKISELPESDYKKLLASDDDNSNRPAIMTDQGLTRNDWNLKYIDEDEDTSPSNHGTVRQVPPFDMNSIKRHSRHLNNSSINSTSNHIMGNHGKNEFAAALKLHEEDDHNDSGLYCASKTTSESTSDTDHNGSDAENGGRPGMFHYFKPYDNKKKYGSCQPSSNSSVLYHNDANYDEAFPASDSDVASPEDSPRDVSRGQLGTELKTIRIHKPETIGPVDRDEDNDSNDDLRSVNLHERLYSNRNSSSFVNMDNEDDEDYVSSEIDHNRASIPWSQKLKGNNFRSYGTYTDSSSSSSSSIKSARNGPKSRPPFGDPVSVEKLGSSVCNLLPRDKKSDVTDMPASAPITEDRSSEESTKQSEGTKKKKKKKKATKGDGGSMKGGVDGDSVDENGNPVEIHRRQTKLISNNFSTSLGSFTRSTDFHSDYRNAVFPRDVDDLQRYSNGQSNSSADDRSEAARKRKAKKQQKDNSVMAENIPDYKGSGKLEDILEFIENPGPGKKKKKALGTAVTTNNLVVDYKNKNKPVKESKKKLSSPPTSSLDNASDRDDDPDEEKRLCDSVRNEPRRLSDLSTQKIPLSNHSFGDARNSLDKYDLCLPPDIETLPPKEAEFQLVTKNKKKKRPTYSTCNNAFLRDETFEVPRETYPWRPVRSVTPPPTKTPTDTLATPPKAEKPAERAFSPSAFPVLSSSVELDFTNSRGRRNSTGNAPIEGIANDNTAIEWVKTSPPPTTEPEVEANSPVSPGGMVKISYAKIAASPKPKNGAPGAVSSPSGVSERRHSFGSMDDANQGIKEVSSMANKNDPKSQSQELVSNTRIQDDDERAAARRNLDSAFQNNSLATCAIQTAPPSKAAEPSAHNNTPTVTLPVTSQSSNITEKPVTTNQVTEKPPIQSHTGPRVPKRSKAKCVIFLDKKLNDMPKNLGITFGFDEDEARSQGLSDIKTDPIAPTNKNTCIDGISFQSEPLGQIDGHKLIIPVNGLTLPAQGLQVDQNQRIILASESNQNQPVSTKTISEHKLWEDLARHESRLGAACTRFNLEDCVRYLVREWERVMDAKHRGVVVEYHSD